MSDERINRRNGYRRREWDTRAGTIELSIPKPRQGSYFPSWLLEPRRRAEQALVQVIADCYLVVVLLPFGGVRARAQARTSRDRAACH